MYTYKHQWYSGVYIHENFIFRTRFQGCNESLHRVDCDIKTNILINIGLVCHTFSEWNKFWTEIKRKVYDNVYRTKHCNVGPFSEWIWFLSCWELYTCFVLFLFRGDDNSMNAWVGQKKGFNTTEIFWFNSPPAVSHFTL